MEKILVTGGAGYLGTRLVPALLQKGYQVRVVDCLFFGGDSIFPFFQYKNFEFIKGDIRDEALMKKALQDVDVVIHLAAIAGYPACEKAPEAATAVNTEATKKIAKMLKPNQFMIFSSTGCNYGKVRGGFCTEETALAPKSHYAKTKTDAEIFLLKNIKNAMVFRFATVFGVSPRVRLDLLIHDFVYQALKNKTLIVYQKNFKRTFIHISDVVRAFLFAIENRNKMQGQAFNVGSDEMDLTKEEVAKKIQKKIDFYLHFAEIAQDQDERDYKMSYEKIKKLGFETEMGMDEALDEVIEAFKVITIKNPYVNPYNVE